MHSHRDLLSANPADQATTAKDRQLLRVWEDMAAVELAKSVDEVAAKRALRAADAAFVVNVNRLRAGYLSDHPGSTEFDFERDLHTLFAAKR